MRKSEAYQLIVIKELEEILPTLKNLEIEDADVYNKILESMELFGLLMFYNGQENPYMRVAHEDYWKPKWEGK